MHGQEINEFMKSQKFDNKKSFMKSYKQMKDRLELQHENIVMLKDMHIKIEEQILVTKYKLYLILDYCVCTLEQHLQKNGKGKKKTGGMVAVVGNEHDEWLGETEAFYMLEQLVEGAIYLEDKGLNRGDIQTTNIMLDSHKNVKLVDCMLFKEPHSLMTIQKAPHSKQAKCLYLAPEQLVHLSSNKHGTTEERELDSQLHQYDHVVDSNQASVF